MKQYLRIILSCCGISLLSACVTQNYADDNKPVVQNDVSNNEIAMTRISLGLGYLKMGNTTQAKLNLEKAKHYAPNLVEVYTAFAHYYEFVGEPEQAITAYRQALTLKADDANTLNNFGVFLCRQGRPQEAEQQWLKAVAVPTYTQVSESYENMANCQLQNDHFAQAEVYLGKAVAHSPGNASSLLQMARLFYAKHDYPQAEAYIHRYEKSTRHFNPEALAVAFKVFEQQGNKQVAQNYAAMLLKMYPQSYQSKQYLLNGLAFTEVDKLAQRYQVSLSSGQPKVESHKRVVKLSPQHPQVTASDTAGFTQQGKAPAPLAVEPGRAKASEEHAMPDGGDSAEVNTKHATRPAKAKAPESGAQSETLLTLPVHVVKAGDSLFSISRKYNIRMKFLLRWNNMKEADVLHIGEVIYLTNPNKAAKG